MSSLSEASSVEPAPGPSISLNLNCEQTTKMEQIVGNATDRLSRGAEGSRRHRHGRLRREGRAECRRGGRAPDQRGQVHQGRSPARPQAPGHTREELETIVADTPASGLISFNVVGLKGKEVPVQPWALQDRIPLRHVTLFSGHGATGKSLMQLQLSVAAVLGRQWLDTAPLPGPVMFVDAEDDENVIHKRLA